MVLGGAKGGETKTSSAKSGAKRQATGKGKESGASFYCGKGCARKKEIKEGEKENSRKTSWFSNALGIEKPVLKGLLQFGNRNGIAWPKNSAGVSARKVQGDMWSKSKSA